MLISIKPKDTKKQPRVFLWTPPGSDKAVPFFDPKKSWDTVRTEAKLPHVHIHDLRHTYAAKMVGKGASIYDLCKLLGHSSIRMTERYAHLDIARLELAVAALD
jgi:integrase